MGVLGLFLLGSCNSKSEHDHEGHSHETEKAHNHDHEGHDHEHEEHDHASENHEGHNHEAEMATGHSDEIILAPEKAKAAGVESEIKNKTKRKAANAIRMQQSSVKNR